jgi:hypothetical protein
MFVVWAVYGSLPAAPPIPVIALPLTSNTCGMHAFALIAIPPLSSLYVNKGRMSPRLDHCKPGRIC